MEVVKRNPQLRKPVATLLKMSEEERNREIEEKQEIYRMDQQSRMDGAYRDGKNEGWEERDKQALNEKLDSARKMKARGYLPEEIADLIGLSPEELEKLQELT